MTNAEQAFYDKGLAIPRYGISHDSFTFKFRNEQFDVKQGQNGFDYWKLDTCERGFKVIPIDALRGFVQET